MYRPLFITALTFIPAIAFAGLVPCDGVTKECDFNALIQLINNILTFVTQTAIVISALLFAYAGWLYITDGGSSKNAEQAKKIFTAVVIGLVVILIAWVLVNTILDVLTGQGLEQRSSIIN